MSMKRVKMTVEQYIREQGISIIECAGIHTYGTTPKDNWFNLTEAGCDGYFCLTIRDKEKTILCKSRLLLATAVKHILAN